MDDRRVGLIIRALRRRRGWRQVDLANAALVSQPGISVIERGHLDTLPMRTIGRVLAALDARVDLDVRWRGGALDRTLDERHAQLVGALVAYLAARGWICEVEVTYAIYGERGSIDVLCFHPATAALLVIEVKTELASIEETLRRLDEKHRLGRRIAGERFRWACATTSKLLVLSEGPTNRRRVGHHAAVLDAALPSSGVGVRRWVLRPVGTLSGRWFFSNIRDRSLLEGSVGPDRIYRPDSKTPLNSPRTNSPAARRIGTR